jgi:hypothetical protein
MRSLVDQFRETIANESETGMLIAADAFDESDDTRNRKMGELLRLYCDIQTYVRTSQPIPQEMGFRFEELNKFFGTQERRYGVQGHYHKPLGPYYTAWTGPYDYLIKNLNVLSEEPVRYLEVKDINSIEDIAMLFRNYRMASLFDIDLAFTHRRRATAAEVAKAIGGMQATSLRRLVLRALPDTAKVVEVAFRMALGIPKGCTLLVAGTSYGTPRTVRTKR